MTVRRGATGVLLAIMLVIVGWVLLYGSDADGFGVLVLLGGGLLFLASLVVTVVGLLRRPKTHA